MKNKLSVALSVLICAVLVIAALGIGAVKGWKQERSEAAAAMNEGGGLYSLRQSRAMDAMNLCAVAARHLPADHADLMALAEAARELLVSTEISRVLAADEDIITASARLEEALSGIDGRDQDYVSALAEALSRDQGLGSGFARIEDDFNSRFSSSLMGKLAAMLGVDALSGTSVGDCQPAGISPRYPEQDSNTTDTARILSATTLEDLATVDKRLKKADAMRLKIATVDFLDGQDAASYADELFERWDLDDEDVLLLLAVGQESYAIHAGSDAEDKLTHALRQELLREHVKPPFDQDDYEGAVVSFTIAFVEKANDLYRGKVSTSGLFGRTGSGLFDRLAAGHFALGQTDDEEGSFFTREDKGTGFSFLKVVLIVAVLLIIFGGRSQKTRDRAAGIADKVKTHIRKS